MDATDADQFAEAFCMHMRGPVSRCDCGRVFWDSYNTGYDWGEGEQECYASDPKATAVPYAVECLKIEGRTCCKDCDCWHERAERIVAWLREHQDRIAEWFSLEKHRLKVAAESVPVIDVPES